jgi:hypothetical protein
MYGYFLLPFKIVVRCKNELFLEFHLFRCLPSFVPAKKIGVYFS